MRVCTLNLQDVEKRLMEEAANLGQLLGDIERADYTESKLHFTASRNFIMAACS